MFSDTLEVAREHLEPGSMVVLTAEATMEEDQLKLLARGVQPVEGVVAGAGGTGLRVFVEAPEAVETTATVLRGAADTKGGRGPIRLCLMAQRPARRGRDRAGRQLPPSRRRSGGALRSLPGVAMVEEF